MSLTRFLPYFCDNCDSAQGIPHLLGGTVSWCCHAPGDNNYRTWHQHKIYVVKVRGELKSDDFQIELDSHGCDVYYELKIKVGEAEQREVALTQNGKGATLSEESWVHLARPPNPMVFSLEKHTKGTFDVVSKKGELDNNQQEYYKKDGSSNFVSTVQIETEDGKCRIELDIDLIVITPRVLAPNAFGNESEKAWLGKTAASAGYKYFPTLTETQPQKPFYWPGDPKSKLANTDAATAHAAAGSEHQRLKADDSDNGRSSVIQVTEDTKFQEENEDLRKSHNHHRLDNLTMMQATTSGQQCKVCLEMVQQGSTMFGCRECTMYGVYVCELCYAENLNDATALRLRWIDQNKAELSKIAKYIDDVDHQFSVNDFSDIQEVSFVQDVEAQSKLFVDYFQLFQGYYLENKYSFLSVKHHKRRDETVIFEVSKEIEDEYFAGKFAQDDLVNLNDAIYLMLRNKYVNDYICTGFDDEFNIYRSYCFDRRDDFRSTKLVLAYFTLCLQTVMTAAVYYGVVVSYQDFGWPNWQWMNVIKLFSTVVIFLMLSYYTSITVSKSYDFYRNLLTICKVPRGVMIGDFISNSVIPILICGVSPFWLYGSEKVVDLVVNSFALIFIYFLDDMVNTFEKDSEFILREDMNLFAGQMRDLFDRKTRQVKMTFRLVDTVHTAFICTSLKNILLSFLGNFVHCGKFVTLFSKNEKIKIQ
eukprot:CAMPEP_0202692230 /NCGR_PEP_ID=MMETSP1385-20130828/6659_1 /ASSEMBLY_ACC=CAM_ASM_000861 /TAXON_ID=933848 /ORGANISM="Elphidium margaritaceum" /LENGTH=701 /DNA_ID=CAMNT_0049347723 /DNA_START=89 /DNA_END=2194 /DNA_ORIENTATION=+